jgi:hypothetical protein
MPKPEDLPIKYQAAANKIQGVLNGLFARVKKMQDDYFQLCLDEKREPKYAQLLWTHKTPVAQGVDKTADNTTAKPGDRMYKKPKGMVGDEMTYDELYPPTWDDIPGAIPKDCRVSVSDYDGPQGKGWVLRAEVVVDGVTVYAERPWGPETYRMDGVDIVDEEV